VKEGDIIKVTLSEGNEHYYILIENLQKRNWPFINDYPKVWSVKVLVMAVIVNNMLKNVGNVCVIIY